MISRVLDRALRTAATGKLLVLAFHDILQVEDPLQPDAIDVGRFEMLLEWAQNNFEIVALEHALHLDEVGRSARVDRPARACLTFDDGYPSWVQTVMPRLLEKGMHATFFVSTGSLQTGIHWHQRLLRIVRALPKNEPLRIDALRLNGMTQAGQLQSIQLLEDALKQLCPAERELFLDQAEALLNPGDRESALDTSGLHRLAQAGFTIGAHSHSHPILTQVSLADAEREIIQSRDILARELGIPIRGFAYPNGRPELDFNQQHVEMLKRSGFTFAVTTAMGWVKPGDDPMLLRRFTPWGNSPLACSRQALFNLAFSG